MSRAVGGVVLADGLVDMMGLVDHKPVEAMGQSAMVEKRLGTMDDIAEVAGVVAEDGACGLTGICFL